MVPKLVSVPPSQRVVNVLLVARGFLGNDILRLLLGADKQHLLAALGQIRDKVVRLLDRRDRLLQVEDMDAVALRKDERAHLGVPPAGLVPEVDARLQQLAHRNGALALLSGCFSL